MPVGPPAVGQRARPTNWCSPTALFRRGDTVAPGRPRRQRRAGSAAQAPPPCVSCLTNLEAGMGALSALLTLRPAWCVARHRPAQPRRRPDLKSTRVAARPGRDHASSPRRTGDHFFGRRALSLFSRPPTGSPVRWCASAGGERHEPRGGVAAPPRPAPRDDRARRAAALPVHERSRGRPWSLSAQRGHRVLPIAASLVGVRGEKELLSILTPQHTSPTHVSPHVGGGVVLSELAAGEGHTTDVVTTDVVVQKSITEHGFPSALKSAARPRAAPPQPAAPRRPSSWAWPPCATRASW
jgi:hypothetical protein